MLPTSKLEALRAKLVETEKQIADPNVTKDPARLRRLTREYGRLKELIRLWDEYRKVTKDLAEAEEILGDPDAPEDLRGLAEEEKPRLEEKLRKLEREIKVLLLPPDPNDGKNVIMEIRPGAGGEEAALFAADLFRMYSRYAERKGWKIEIGDIHKTDLGGIKFVSFIVEGDGAWSRLKYEGGVHRVQRVPVTESGGRIHTSTATVAVLPEAEEVDVEIRPEDLRVETFRAGGHGGQYVNKTESAVRITHIPTGITVSVQDERSQHQNREKAMRILRSKIYELERQKKEKEMSEARKSQIKTGERSEKIRTYNFPQNRVTDHRINLTLYNLEAVLDGDLDPIIDALIAEDQRRLLEQMDLEEKAAG